jgi:hypothetical protein
LTAKSEILPDAQAGPILLNDNPAKVELNTVSFFSDTFTTSFFFCPETGLRLISNKVISVMRICFFIFIMFLTCKVNLAKIRKSFSTFLLVLAEFVSFVK